MLPDGSVQVHRIWKRFRAGQRRLLFRDELERIRAHIKGEEVARWRWALRDVDFAVSPGESIGLIGANGSGKSTLLKILCGVMYPYAGDLRIAGRIGALIEVRAGIHQDLTGRENVFLYGSLLGLSRRKVAERFDEIIAFAELEEAVDRQVKFYSSGMQMRLGFAVSAFLEPDVLLVDEVLAVGDASFQQRCLNRMKEVLDQGTTLVFVSHDLAAVEATCRRGIWLKDGVIEADGSISKVLSDYRSDIERSAEAHSGPHSGLLEIVKTQVTGASGGPPQSHHELRVNLVVRTEAEYESRAFVGVSEGAATPIFCVHRDLTLDPGETRISCAISHLPLARGRFYIWTAFHENPGQTLLMWQPVASFDVIGETLDPAPQAVVRLAPVQVASVWHAESE